MRTARFTYKGAYHHIISRGLNGKDIFLDDYDRNRFRHMLEKKAALYGISIFAYSLMSNHYHLAICNRTGRMSDMMRVLNGGYAVSHRKKHGGRGYVFQDRYKSILIENKIYLYRVMRYILVNSAAAGIVSDPFKYGWSSINDYFESSRTFVDISIIRSMFKNEKEFRESIWEHEKKPPEIKKGDFGFYIGSTSFENKIKVRTNRRKRDRKGNHPYMRKAVDGMQKIIPKEHIMRVFANYYGIRKADKLIDKSSYSSKKKVDILIKLLKDEGALTYREISKELGLKYNSLPNRCKRARLREIPRDLMDVIKKVGG